MDCILPHDIKHEVYGVRFARYKFAEVCTDCMHLCSPLVETILLEDLRRLVLDTIRSDYVKKLFLMFTVP
jgi:hypothetical protein